QDGFSQPAQDTSFDDAKPQPVDQQSSGFPDDFVLEDEMCWLEGMFSEIHFQLQQGIEPVALTGKDRRTFMQNDEGRGLRCRHGLRFLWLYDVTKMARGADICSVY